MRGSISKFKTDESRYEEDLLSRFESNEKRLDLNTLLQRKKNEKNLDKKKKYSNFFWRSVFCISSFFNCRLL